MIDHHPIPSPFPPRFVAKAVRPCCISVTSTTLPRACQNCNNLADYILREGRGEK